MSRPEGGEVYSYVGSFVINTLIIIYAHIYLLQPPQHSYQLSRNNPGHPGLLLLVSVPHGRPFLCTTVPELSLVDVKHLLMKYFQNSLYSCDHCTILHCMLKFK